MKKILTIAVLFMMLFTAAGCSMPAGVMEMLGQASPGEERYNVVLIVDKTRYAPEYDLEGLLGDEIAKCYRQKEDKLTVICPDGSGMPSSQEFTFKGTDKKVDNNSMKRVIRKENAKVFDFVNGMQPAEKELNLLPAFQLAASELASDETAIGRVYLVTSGLTTMEPLNMCSGLNFDTAGTISALKKRDMIPDFDGTTIHVYGLGYVAKGKEQKSLSASEQKFLTSFYENLLLAANANCVTHTNTPNSGNVASFSNELPYVTPVRVGMQENVIVTMVDTDVSLEPENMIVDPSSEVILFPQETLNYKPGSAEFTAPSEGVKKLLEPIAAWYSERHEKLYVLSGTASCGTEKELMDLSGKRGNAVKETLVSLGVNADDVIVVPMGYRLNPYKSVDTVNGMFNEEEARKNRVTYVISEENDAALAMFKDALDY